MKEVGHQPRRRVPQTAHRGGRRRRRRRHHHGLRRQLPLHPGRRYEDWPIADPAETDADGVEAIRDDIDTRVRQLLDSLLPGMAMPELTHPKP